MKSKTKILKKSFGDFVSDDFLDLAADFIFYKDKRQILSVRPNAFPP
jgi:hypothetical protein